MRNVLSAAAVTALTLLGAPCSTAEAPLTASLQFLVGRWETPYDGGRMEKEFFATKDDKILIVTRVFHGGVIDYWDYILIERGPGGAVLRQFTKGEPGPAFSMKELAGDRAAFEAAEPSFITSLSFERRGAHLASTISGPQVPPRTFEYKPLAR